LQPKIIACEEIQKMIQDFLSMINLTLVVKCSDLFDKLNSLNSSLKGLSENIIAAI